MGICNICTALLFVFGSDSLSTMQSLKKGEFVNNSR